MGPSGAARISFAGGTEKPRNLWRLGLAGAGLMLAGLVSPGLAEDALPPPLRDQVSPDRDIPSTETTRTTVSPSTSGPLLWTREPMRVSPALNLPRVAPRPPRDPFTELLSVPRTLVVIDSTRFRVKDRFYRVPGLVAVEPRRICKDRDGARWACGLASRVALRTLVAGRHLACLPGPEDSAAEDAVEASGEASAAGIASRADPGVTPEILLTCKLDADRHLAEELLRLGAARLASHEDPDLGETAGDLPGQELRQGADQEAAERTAGAGPGPVRLHQIEAEAQAAGAGLWRAVDDDGGRP